MDINSISLHPQYPDKVWVIVEQPRDEPFRFRYDPISQTFSRTSHKTLGYERGVNLGVYGWIGGSGIPPEPHHDVILVTRQSPRVGSVLLGYICGVFLRHDNDNKFVAVDDAIGLGIAKVDIECLDEIFHQQLLQIYPRIGEGEGEGWFGAQIAYTYLRKKPLV